MQGGLASIRFDSPPRCCCVTHGTELVESSIEHLVIRHDFQSALDSCERGLECLNKSDNREEACSKNEELKATLCIVGVQALAELNRWRDVLTWILRHYSETVQIPAKVMQLCILLYTKVSEQAAVQEAVRTWLYCPSNTGLSGYSSVAELYILHVLLPLGQTTQAKQLLEGEVGQVAFTEDQRQTALTVLEGSGANTEPDSHPHPEPVHERPERVITAQESLMRKFRTITRMLYRCLSVVRTNAWSCFVYRTVALLFLLYLLLLRLDAASATALPWILRLHSLLQQVWNAMCAPYYRASS